MRHKNAAQKCGIEMRFSKCGINTGTKMVHKKVSYKKWTIKSGIKNQSNSGKQAT